MLCRMRSKGVLVAVLAVRKVVVQESPGPSEVVVEEETRAQQKSLPQVIKLSALMKVELVWQQATVFAAT